MTAALPWIFAGVGALSSFQASGQAAKVAEYNARVAESNAIQERLFAQEDARRMRVEGMRERGRIRAKAGASGVDSGTGSVLDVLSDEAINNELDALSIQAKGEAAARSHLADAAGFKQQAKNARSGAFLSALGAGLSGYAGGAGASSLLGSLGSSAAIPAASAGGGSLPMLMK